LKLVETEENSIIVGTTALNTIPLTIELSRENSEIRK